MTILTFGHRKIGTFFLFYHLTFLLDKQNYAPYGSFYVNMLLNMKATYRGLKTLFTEKEIFFQGQNCYPLSKPTRRSNYYGKALRRRWKTISKNFVMEILKYLGDSCEPTKTLSIVTYLRIHWRHL